MKYKIIAAGKPALHYAQIGIEKYQQRLKHYTPLEINYIKAGDPQTVSQNLLQQSQKTHRITLDERGTQLTTSQLLKKINHWEIDPGIKSLTFLIGPSDGHTQELRQQSHFLWALSPLTLQHELALLVLLEQLYRIHTIKRGEPYHR